MDYLKEKNNKNYVGLNKSYIEKIIEDNEEICRKIIIKLYKDFFKKIYEYVCFSFYNINMIIIKNWENSIEYKINPIEFYITLKIRFTSGTSTTQAPRKQILVMYSPLKQNRTKNISKKINKNILQFMGILTKYIINCKLDKSFDLISIPSLISQECRTFLETCFLNLKEFEELQYLDFLDEKIEFKQFHYNYPKSEERSINSYLSSIFKDEDPKKMNKNNNLIIMNNSYSILGLNSFCIKPEEKKINYKDKKEIEKRKLVKKNFNIDKSLPFDDINDIIFEFYPDDPSQEYSINDILKKKIEDSERNKKQLIKEYLQPLKIYTYPISNKNN